MARATHGEPDTVGCHTGDEYDVQDRGINARNGVLTMRLAMFRAIAALCLLGTAAAVPASASSGNATKAKCAPTKPKTHHTLRTASATPAISLGATGGNMVPW